MIHPYVMAALAGLLVSLSAFGGWSARSVIADRDLAEVHADHAAQIEAANARTQAAERNAAAAVEQEVLRERERTAQAQARVAALAAARADAAGAAQRLRDHIARLAAATAAEHPAAALGSETVAGAGLVFADLYGSEADEADELGAALDEALARGLACERSYDRVRAALKGGP
jgi:hypothetical protein